MLYTNGIMELDRIVTYKDQDGFINGVLYRTKDKTLIIAYGIHFDDESHSCYWNKGHYHQSWDQVGLFIKEMQDQYYREYMQDLKDYISKAGGLK